MYSLTKILGAKDILLREFVPFAVSLVIAQLFFKWGSFALELIGFMALWFALGAVATIALNTLKK